MKYTTTDRSAKEVDIEDVTFTVTVETSKRLPKRIMFTPQGQHGYFFSHLANPIVNFLVPLPLIRSLIRQRPWPRLREHQITMMLSVGPKRTSSRAARAGSILIHFFDVP